MKNEKYEIILTLLIADHFSQVIYIYICVYIYNVLFSEVNLSFFRKFLSHRLMRKIINNI